MTTPAPSPDAIYTRRLEDRLALAARLARSERLTGNARVLVFLALLLLGWLALGPGLLSGWWLAPVLLGFVALLVVHGRIVRSWRRVCRAVAFYRAGLTRIDDTWMGKGRQGQRYLNEGHPYAADLDLFGSGSLFERLCTAHTRAGEDRLAAWLLAPASPGEVRARQEATRELRPMLDLREGLAVLTGELPASIDFESVARWGSAPPLLPRLWLRWPIMLLGLATLTALAGWLLTTFGFLDGSTAFGAFFLRWGSLPFLLCGTLELALAGWLYRPVQEVLRTVERRSHDLALLAHILALLEQLQLSAGRLRQLHEALIATTGARGGLASSRLPSQQIAQLSNLIDLLSSRRNQLFAPFAFIMLWGTQMAHAIEGWRARSGKAIEGWLEVVGEVEALCSLAAYAFENPENCFPTVVEDEVCYEGEGLGHPLLPASRCVRNDISLRGQRRVLVVSGSNMSGKSTYLRTVGVNAVLALAGAPVRAARLTLSTLALGATLRIQDSLQAGRSRFYAEILRVRQLVDLSRGPLPLLFLLDEIFAGTNSHDRRLGAEAVVRGLVDRGAIGLVTTHDLSLTHIADLLGTRAENVHFADHFESGEMIFDYRLQQGVVQKSNALALMRAVGLEV